MVYIRVKRINKQPYAYLVENISTKNGPRQKVKKYLGRIYDYKKNDQDDQSIIAKTKQEFIKNLVVKQLQNHGFKTKDNHSMQDKVSFSLNDLQFNTGVLAINEGYLCNHTIQQLLEFRKSKDLTKDAHVLAKNFLLAGLPVSKEEFVDFYQLL